MPTDNTTCACEIAASDLPTATSQTAIRSAGDADNTPADRPKKHKNDHDE
jgi:hypothetical protein